MDFFGELGMEPEYKAPRPGPTPRIYASLSTRMRTCSHLYHSMAYNTDMSTWACIHRHVCELVHPAIGTERQLGYETNVVKYIVLVCMCICKYPHMIICTHTHTHTICLYLLLRALLFCKSLSLSLVLSLSLSISLSVDRALLSSIRCVHCPPTSREDPGP